MNCCKSKHTLLPALVLFTGLACAGAQAAPVPAGDYACQVRASGGKLGLVRVQAESVEDAERMAIGAPAETTDGGSATATAIIECIGTGEQRFKDIQFQNFLESLPS